MTDKTTNHEQLQNALIPEEEKAEPKISPSVAAQMGRDRDRDLQAQQDGTISRLYDLESPGEN